MLSFLQSFMRLDEVYRNLLNEQLEYYDRMYTLSSGPENGWTIPLKDARRTFIANRFPILKPPFVEEFLDIIKMKIGVGERSQADLVAGKNKKWKVFLSYCHPTPSGLHILIKLSHLLSGKKENTS